LRDKLAGFGDIKNEQRQNIAPSKSDCRNAWAVLDRANDFTRKLKRWKLPGVIDASTAAKAPQPDLTVLGLFECGAGNGHGVQSAPSETARCAGGKDQFGSAAAARLHDPRRLGRRRAGWSPKHRSPRQSAPSCSPKPPAMRRHGAWLRGRRAVHRAEAPRTPHHREPRVARAARPRQASAKKSIRPPKKVWMLVAPLIAMTENTFHSRATISRSCARTFRHERARECRCALATAISRAKNWHWSAHEKKGSAETLPAPPRNGLRLIRALPVSGLVVTSLRITQQT